MGRGNKINNSSLEKLLIRNYRITASFLLVILILSILSLGLYLEYSYNKNIINSIRPNIQRSFNNSKIREIRLQVNNLIDAGFSRIQLIDYKSEVLLDVNETGSGISVGIEVPFYTNSNKTFSNGMLKISYPLGAMAIEPLLLVFLGIVFLIVGVFLYIPRYAKLKAVALNYKRRENEIEVLRKLAHDLRAPLELLEMCSEIDTQEDRELFTMVTNRLKSVSNEVLNRTRFNETNLKIALDELVEEKRFITKNKNKNLEFVGQIELDDNLTYSEAESLLRVLSNLIDNAFDAIDIRGRVDFFVGFTKRKIEIVLRDDGRGIPKHILKELGKRQLSYGKLNGNGIGVFSAAEFASSVNGKFSIKSIEGSGTRVDLSIPI